MRVTPSVAVLPILFHEASGVGATQFSVPLGSSSLFRSIRTRHTRIRATLACELPWLLALARPAATRASPSTRTAATTHRRAPAAREGTSVGGHDSAAYPTKLRLTNIRALLLRMKTPHTSRPPWLR